MMNNKKSVFYVSLAFSLVLISLGAFIPDKLEAFSNYSLGFIYNNLGWFILGAVFIFFSFCMYLGFSKFGHIRLGEDSDRPEYRTATWVGMLFSASIGISLVFWELPSLFLTISALQLVQAIPNKQQKPPCNMSIYIGGLSLGLLCLSRCIISLFPI